MSIGSGVLRGLVRGYQIGVSPFLPPSCKYTPSCSHYALDALDAHGAVKGLGLAVWRILRCNPFSRGGYDPVPGTDPRHDAARSSPSATTPACRHGCGDASHPPSAPCPPAS